jgi:hypothetical protein
VIQNDVRPPRVVEPAIAWALPHRRSLRMLPMTAAGAGLGCALLPVLFAMLMAMAMASG